MLELLHLEELLKRDKVNLDLFWLKDDSLRQRQPSRSGDVSS